MTAQNPPKAWQPEKKKGQNSLQNPESKGSLSQQATPISLARTAARPS